MPVGHHEPSVLIWPSRFVLMAVVALSSQAFAQLTPPSLPGPAELAAAEPLLRRGQVTIVTPSPGKGRAGVIVLAKVRAPVSTAYNVVANPTRYPEFMQSLEEAKVTSKRGHALTYTFRWRAGGLPWKGSCAMALAPHRDIAVRILRSDFGTGQLRWHFTPRTKSSSLMIEAATFDMNASNSVLKFLLARGDAMPEALGLTLSTVLIEGSRGRAEAIARPSASKAKASKAASLTVAELLGIGPLLSRGAVVVVEGGADGTFKRALVVEAVDAPLPVLQKLLSSPERWSKAVPIISQLKVNARQGSSAQDVRISMNLSIFTISGTARITQSASGVVVEGLDGGLSKTKLRFTATSLPDGRTVLQSVGRADMVQASFVLRRLVKREPTFVHGLNSAAQLLFVRGLAREAERLAARSRP